MIFCQLPKFGLIISVKMAFDKKMNLYLPYFVQIE